jgi:hypothetical protein
MVSSVFALPSSAANPSVDIVCRDAAPVVLSPSDSLFNIKNLNPGDYYETTITINNKIPEVLSLYLKDMSQTFDDSSLSGLVFSLRDASGATLMTTSDLYTLLNTPLGSLAANSPKTYTLSLYAPSELTNEYQGARNLHSLTFAVLQSGANNPCATPKNPITGFASLASDFASENALPLSILSGALLSTLFFLLVIFLKRRKTHEN